MKLFFIFVIMLSFLGISYAESITAKMYGENLRIEIGKGFELTKGHDRDTDRATTLESDNLIFDVYNDKVNKKITVTCDTKNRVLAALTVYFDDSGKFSKLVCATNGNQQDYSVFSEIYDYDVYFHITPEETTHSSGSDKQIVYDKANNRYALTSMRGGKVELSND